MIMNPIISIETLRVDNANTKNSHGRRMYKNKYYIINLLTIALLCGIIIYKYGYY